MAYHNNPRIITDGLVLCLDAADKKSYPGSGTTWYDRSRYKNHGTLTNGPTFDSSNGGSINFDGTNDYVATPFRTNSGYEYCYSVWYKTSSTLNQNLIGSYQPGFSTFNLDINLNQLTNSPSVGYVSLFAQFFGGRYRLSNTTTLNLSDGGWHNITCFVVIGSTAGLFFDGQAIPLTTYQNDNGLFNSTALDIWIGNANINGSPYSRGTLGKLGQTLIYNRAFTSSEIQQNYNAMKGRYNL